MLKYYLKRYLLTSEEKAVSNLLRVIHKGMECVYNTKVKKNVSLLVTC